MMSFLSIDKERHSKYISIYLYYYYYCFIQLHPLGGLSDMFDSMLHASIVNWSAQLYREEGKKTKIKLTWIGHPMQHIIK